MADNATAIRQCLSDYTQLAGVVCQTLSQRDAVRETPSGQLRQSDSKAPSRDSSDSVPTAVP